MTVVEQVNGRELEQHEIPDWWRQLQDADYDYHRPRRGDFLTGTILEIRPEALIVDIGAKRDGFVPAHDLTKLESDEVGSLKTGDEIPVFVERPSNRAGDLVLSLSRGKELDDWKEARRLLADDELIELQVEGYNRGGMTVRFGQIQGFVPASQLVGLRRTSTDEERREALAARLGEVLRLKVIEVEQSRRRFVLSQRKGERAYRQQRKAELLETLSIGDTVTGKVTSLKGFGAFVDIGGADGLVHVSEISHDRIEHPGEKLKIGQEVETRVVRLDPERKRIGLSVKVLAPSPWDNIHERYYPGQVVPATISNVVHFGAFAALEPGLEGLIHVSKLSHYHVAHPEAVVSQDDEVMVRILSIDPERRRISLSLRDVPQWVDESSAATAEQIDEQGEELDAEQGGQRDEQAMIG
jgi:small subunit ribosomal protein S1